MKYQRGSKYIHVLQKKATFKKPSLIRVNNLFIFRNHDWGLLLKNVPGEGQLECNFTVPIVRGRKLNVHKTFRRHLLKVLCTFKIRPVSTGIKRKVMKNISKILQLSKQVTMSLQKSCTLTHCQPMFQFYCLTRCFRIFSGGRKVENCFKIS